MRTAKVLGILSLCYSLIPMVGVITAIVGLFNYDKDPKHEWDKNLCILGLVVSIVLWVLNLYYG